MSVAAPDENKVFGAVFRTPPTDSTGIPHILEHSVLCGSRKYPIKEPFVELMKGSLNTFLNAFTYPDRTCYPVASTNLADFYNLVDVYLDAVFFPRCVSDERVFQQEGWHYEVSAGDDRELTYKGVVFNEMKGVYSQPDSMLARYCQQAMFPDNTYGVDSGGDPAVIPSLTFAQFQEFHRKFYHPSNARIWFYGDDDPTRRLQILSEYLDKFDQSNAAAESEVTVQPLFKEPRAIVQSYAAGTGPQEDDEDDDGTPASATEERRGHMVSVNWLLAEEPLTVEQELALSFLDHLLLGTPAAPLRQALLQSGLGEALVGGGLEGDLRQPSFAIGLKGCTAESSGKVEDLVLATLRDLADGDGFSNDAVEASINTIEFSLRENNTGSFPRGLSLMLRSMGKWLYGGDPLEPLRFAKPLADLKARLAEQGIKGVFSPLIHQFLLNNPHRVTIKLQPDAELGKRQEELERQQLAAVKESMTEEDLAELQRATDELRRIQETPDDPEALRVVPSLSLEDIPQEPAHVPIDVHDAGDGAVVLRHDLFTNDVLYAELALDMRGVPASLLPLVPLFCQSLMEMGTDRMTFVELSQLIGRKTGGISVYPMTSSVRGKADPSSHLIVRGKAMAAQAADLFNLMRTLLMEVRFEDQQRFKQFVSQSKARMESRVIGSGHSFAAARLDAMHSIAGWASEQMGGLSYLEYVRSLEKRVDQEWPQVVEALETIRKSVLARHGAILNLTADEATLTSSEALAKSLLDQLPSAAPVDIAGEPWNVVLPVNYVGKAANLFDTGYKLHGSSYVISKHLGTTWLWDRVRVSGGAYGGFCDFDSHSGMFTYLSYRDPNLLKTLDNYDGTVDFLRALELDSSTLTKAIVGTIGDIDSYQLPDAKGYSSMVRYMLGITEEERKQRRHEVLSTSLDDFHKFADALEVVRNSGSIVVVAAADSVDKANADRPSLNLTKRVVL
eukprot:SM000148S01050  [mRNA]  locus=s148:321856:326518:- [translate_table: standard]